MKKTKRFHKRKRDEQAEDDTFFWKKLRSQIFHNRVYTPTTSEGFSTTVMSRKVPLVLDGGTGRELLKRGVKQIYPNVWSANALVDNPQIIRNVHFDFIKAGADIVTTCTYSCTLETSQVVNIPLRKMIATACKQAKDAVLLSKQNMVIVSVSSLFLAILCGKCAKYSGD